MCSGRLLIIPTKKDDTRLPGFPSMLSNSIPDSSCWHRTVDVSCTTVSLPSFEVAVPVRVITRVTGTWEFKLPSCIQADSLHESLRDSNADICVCDTPIVVFG